jgi:hypothetical protein
MSEVIEKNFEAIRTVLNAQGKTIRDLQEQVKFLEGNVSRLQAEIINTKQLVAHIGGRGMGSTVHHGD